MLYHSCSKEWSSCFCAPKRFATLSCQRRAISLAIPMLAQAEREKWRRIAYRLTARVHDHLRAHDDAHTCPNKCLPQTNACAGARGVARRVRARQDGRCWHVAHRRRAAGHAAGHRRKEHDGGCFGHQRANESGVYARHGMRLVECVWVLPAAGLCAMILETPNCAM
jgi:hypothetical protein